MRVRRTYAQLATETDRACRQCGERKPLDGFAKDSRKINGRAYRCRECDRARHREYHQKPEAKERDALYRRDIHWSDPQAARERRSKYRSAHPQPRERDPIKAAARRAVNEAVRYGRLPKPSACQDCGATGRIHGHHEDYNRPLAVDWLCARCHGVRHRKYDAPDRAAYAARGGRTP